MDRAMEIIKKNVLSIVCGLIAILAIVAAMFWPLPGNFTSLQTKVAARATEYTALQTLSTKTRNLPITDPTDPTPKPLDMFPTPTAIDRAQKVVAAISDEGKKVLDLAVKYNEHKLLLAGVLPSPTRSAADEFQKRYEAEMDYFNPNEDVRSKTLPYRVLRVGIPPTDAQITEEGAAREKKMTDEQLIPGPNGNQAVITKMVAEMRASLAEDMRSDVAAKSKIYMNADAVDVYPNIILGNANPAGAVGGGVGAGGGANTLTPSSIYYAQVGLWVQQDVFQALAEANAKANSIEDAPVKHLLKIDVHEDAGHVVAAAPGVAAPAPLTAGSVGPGVMVVPAANYTVTAVASDGSTPAAASTGIGPTGHVSGPLYDVVPFHLVINVDATRIPEVLLALGRNRFITVTRMDISAVNATTAMVAGYRYGKDVPVVQLNMDCEALLLKEWLKKYQPPVIANPPSTTPPS